MSKEPTKAREMTGKNPLLPKPPKPRGAPKKTMSRQGLYAKAALYAQESIEVLVKLMRTSRHESIRFNCAKALLNKALPDLKAVEVTSFENGQYLIKLDVPQINANNIIQPTGELQESSD